MLADRAIPLHRQAVAQLVIPQERREPRTLAAVALPQIVAALAVPAS